MNLFTLFLIAILVLNVLQYFGVIKSSERPIHNDSRPNSFYSISNKRGK